MRTSFSFSLSRRRGSFSQLRLLHQWQWSPPSSSSPSSPHSSSTSSYDSNSGGSGALKLVSWNLLGPMHGETPKHNYAQREHALWKFRKERIVEELRRLEADVYCLQEVSMDALTNTFLPKMQEMNYALASFSPTSNPNLPPRPDSSVDQSAIGCAIFVNNASVNVVSARRAYLKNFSKDISKKSRCKQFVNDVESKWHSVALAQLQTKVTGHMFVVGNTHLFWNPTRPDIRAVQAHSVMNALTSFVSSLSLPPRCGVVLCGDFNCGPQSTLSTSSAAIPLTPSSGVFELLNRGSLGPSHRDHPDRIWRRRMRLNKDVINPSIGVFGRNQLALRLSNIFSLGSFSKYEPKFTTKTDDFQGWIDHIWVNDAVAVERVLIPPITAQRKEDSETDSSENDQNNAFENSFLPIPNEAYPSDHIPIGCAISLK